jgi:deoxyribodipyrimidine photo-lyase
MRELRATGWMHNRVRMLAASFLVKHLMIHWQEGAKCFHETLVDADLSNNILGWQWVAGCGADAAPFFRIFNPTLQGEKFDPDGEYVRRWVPELAELPVKYIHAPWKAPEKVLKTAGITLPGVYPAPAVEHKGARDRALMAWQAIRKNAEKNQ